MNRADFTRLLTPPVVSGLVAVIFPQAKPDVAHRTPKALERKEVVQVALKLGNASFLGLEFLSQALPNSHLPPKHVFQNRTNQSNQNEQ